MMFMGTAGIYRFFIKQQTLVSEFPRSARFLKTTFARLFWEQGNFEKLFCPGGCRR